MRALDHPEKGWTFNIPGYIEDIPIYGMTMNDKHVKLDIQDLSFVYEQNLYQGIAAMYDFTSANTGTWQFPKTQTVWLRQFSVGEAYCFTEIASMSLNFGDLDFSSSEQVRIEFSFTWGKCQKRYANWPPYLT